MILRRQGYLKKMPHGDSTDSSIYRHFQLSNYIIFPCIFPYGNFTRESFFIEGWCFLRNSISSVKVILSAFAMNFFFFYNYPLRFSEALMRLKIPGIGLIFPDQFFPLAEENGYIHVLTEIILQKTCDEIRYLLKEGYVNRISINVAVSELKEESFTQDIQIWRESWNFLLISSSLTGLWYLRVAVI